MVSVQAGKASAKEIALPLLNSSDMNSGTWPVAYIHFTSVLAKTSFSHIPLRKKNMFQILGLKVYVCLVHLRYF